MIKKISKLKKTNKDQSLNIKDKMLKNRKTFISFLIAISLAMNKPLNYIFKKLLYLFFLSSFYRWIDNFFHEINSNSWKNPPQDGSNTPTNECAHPWMG